jgi:hypothetical protein
MQSSNFTADAVLASSSSSTDYANLFGITLAPAIVFVVWKKEMFIHVQFK